MPIYKIHTHQGRRGDQETFESFLHSLWEGTYWLLSFRRRKSNLKAEITNLKHTIWLAWNVKIGTTNQGHIIPLPAFYRNNCKKPIIGKKYGSCMLFDNQSSFKKRFLPKKRYNKIQNLQKYEATVVRSASFLVKRLKQSTFSFLNQIISRRIAEVIDMVSFFKRNCKPTTIGQLLVFSHGNFLYIYDNYINFVL